MIYVYQLGCYSTFIGYRVPAMQKKDELTDSSLDSWSNGAGVNKHMHKYC